MKKKFLTTVVSAAMATALSFALTAGMVACSDDSSPTSTSLIAGDENLSSLAESSSAEQEYSSAVAPKSSAATPKSSATVAMSSVAAPKSSATVPVSSAVAPASSPTVPASSAAAPGSSAMVVSSSSVAPAVDSLPPATDQARLVIKNAVGQCGTLQNFNASQDAGFRPAEKSDMRAFRSVGSDSTEFLIRNVQLTCGWVLDSLEITTSGDTLVVNAEFDRSNAQRCLCDYQFLFKVKSNPVYSNSNFVTLRTDSFTENDHTTPILDSEIWGSDPVAHVQVASKVSATCSNNGVMENAPSRVASRIEVNLVEDTTSFERNAPYATMKILDNGFISIVVDGIYLSCGVIIESVSVASTGGNTIFASIKEDPSSPIVNCLCPSRISFDIKNENGFANASYINFDGIGLIQILKTKE